VLGGSQARGEGVWVERSGRWRCLSDLDLHVVVADGAARARAERAAAAGRAALLARLEDLGLAGPLDVGFHTPAEWKETPARPATLELRRSGRTLAGDPQWIERLPAWTPADVPAEERRLLLENRAFDLIASRWAPAAGEASAGFLLACHAQYKCALDLAAIERLAAGAYEPGAGARVRAAREARAAAGLGDEEPAWEGALAWLAGRVPEPAARDADWWRVARGWVAAWVRASGERANPGAFENVALASARRARFRRRLRLAVAPEMRRGHRPPLAARLGRTLVGTPQHRLNASAGAFLAAQCAAQARPEESAAIHARLARVLARLGAVRAGGDDADTARALVATWNRWVMGGPRGPVRP